MNTNDLAHHLKFSAEELWEMIWAYELKLRFASYQHVNNFAWSPLMDTFVCLHGLYLLVFISIRPMVMLKDPLYITCIKEK